jgi:sugar/nucleoside kinase (ribokinase family)
MVNLKKKFVAVENSVVDLQYHRNQGDEALQKKFFKTLKENIEKAGHEAPFAENPRAGDALLISAEVFDDACIEFGRENGLFGSSHRVQGAEDMALYVRDMVFGYHDSVSGGSLANTFHTMQMAKLDGEALIDGTFVTCVGDDRYGKIFADDMKGHIKADKIGRQMVCHVFPAGGDRILIATPAADNPAEKNISAELVQDEITADIDRVAVGGFLYFTGRYEEVIESILNKAEQLGDDAPTLVLTAASQIVSASEGFRAEFNRAARRMDTIVHANTGEFRRLLDMDTEWRKPFEKDFAGLTGHDLEEAKDAHSAYQAAKQEANRAALLAALELAHGIKGVHGRDLKFVVTNGSKGIFTVNTRDGVGIEGVSSFKPAKVDKASIVNTVGAGDNFAAGYQLGDLSGFPSKSAVKLGAEMAASVIQIPEARLSDTASRLYGAENARLFEGLPFKAEGGMSYVSDDSLWQLSHFRKMIKPR